MHVHFGMSGRFGTFSLPGPADTPTTRLRLVHAESQTVALLSAMTVQHGGLSLLAEKEQQMGPDPLREDADGLRLWAVMQKTKRPIGLVLMDQACIAGVGNIYRAEILFKAGVHPEQPANTISLEGYESIWRHSVDLLQRGFATGSILTVDASEGLPASLRRYIYNQSSCPRCSSQVRSWDMASRTAYACETCQPLIGDLSGARKKALAKATPVKLFISHCAPDAVDGSLPPHKMTVAQLREALQAKGAAPAKSAGKEKLVRMLLDLHAGEPKAAEAAAAAAPAAEAAAPIRTGTAHLRFASAAEAAAEKLAAGESAAVEHIALADDEALKLRRGAKQPRAAEAGIGAAFPQRKRATR